MNKNKPTPLTVSDDLVIASRKGIHKWGPQESVKYVIDLRKDKIPRDELIPEDYSSIKEFMTLPELLPKRKDAAFIDDPFVEGEESKIRKGLEYALRIPKIERRINKQLGLHYENYPLHESDQVLLEKLDTKLKDKLEVDFQLRSKISNLEKEIDKEKGLLQHYKDLEKQEKKFTTGSGGHLEWTAVEIRNLDKTITENQKHLAKLQSEEQAYGTTIKHLEEKQQALGEKWREAEDQNINVNALGRAYKDAEEIYNKAVEEADKADDEVIEAQRKIQELREIEETQKKNIEHYKHLEEAHREKADKLAEDEAELKLVLPSLRKADLLSTQNINCTQNINKRSRINQWIRLKSILKVKVYGVKARDEITPEQFIKGELKNINTTDDLDAVITEDKRISQRTKFGKVVKALGLTDDEALKLIKERKKHLKQTGKEIIVVKDTSPVYTATPEEQRKVISQGIKKNKND